MYVCTYTLYFDLFALYLDLMHQAGELHCLCGLAGASSRTFQHTLLMRMDSSTGAVQHAELQPEGVDIQDIGTAAVASQQGPSFVVSVCCLGNSACLSNMGMYTSRYKTSKHLHRYIHADCPSLLLLMALKTKYGIARL